MPSLQRQYDLDWLRVLAVSLVLIYHVGMIFVSWDFHIKNNETTRVLEYIMAWFHYWRMPLLLFVSGAGTFLALRKRTIKAYIGERHRRLLIPLIVAMLVIVPPQVYLEKINDYTNFWTFYPTIFTTGPYPEGNLSWHHMWFVLYLLFYSVISIPLFKFLKTDHSNSFYDRLKSHLSKKWGFTSLVLIIILTQVILKPFFPDETHAFIDDWANLTFLYCFFIAGFIFYCRQDIWYMIKNRRRFHLYLGLVTLGILLFLYWLPYDWLSPLQADIANIIWQINGVVTGWVWVLTFVGYGQQYLHHNHPWLATMNEGIYPFYILHQTIVLTFGYFVIQLSWGWAEKFVVITFLSFAGTIGSYLIFVRPFNFMRLFFGMKRK